MSAASQDRPRVDEIQGAFAEAIMPLTSYPWSDPKKLHRANQDRCLAAGVVAAIDAALAVPSCEYPAALKHIKALLTTPAEGDASS